MKKTLFLALGLIAFKAHSQEFHATPTGLYSDDAASKDYVVVEVPGLTANQLYNNAHKFIQKTYKNPKEVVKGDVKDEYIRFETFVDKAFYLKAALGTKNWGDIHYTTQIDFKDGKAKISLQSVELKPDYDRAAFTISWVHTGMTSLGIFTKTGEVKQEEAKSVIESYFNSYIAGLAAEIKGNNKQEEW